MAAKFDRPFLVLLIAGIALRCVALNQPLVDAHAMRQCQTAVATENLIKESGFHLSTQIPWAGDLHQRYVLELPLYNYLVIGIHYFVRHLDASGKLTSIVLWALSFLLLQFIWRRCLDPDQAIWANLLFVIAPLSVFFGQAFMPEMLIQVLAFGFVILLLRYDESPTLWRWTACAATGLLALLIKLPETAHLYLILAFFVFRREKWGTLTRPRYWIGAIVTIIAIKSWSGYIDSLNGLYVPEWTSRGDMEKFIGTLGDRFQFKTWFMIFLYVFALIIPGPAIFAAGHGLRAFFQKPHKPILGIWLASLVAYYLIWFGPAGPAGQSYYNLPALAPLCALFGLGMQELLASEWIKPWQRLAISCSVILAVLPAAPVWAYLFQQDRQILTAADWANKNTKPGDVVLFSLDHRTDMINYPNNPIPAYYSERPTFVWTPETNDQFKKAALERARFAITTFPTGRAAGLRQLIDRFRRSKPPRHLETNKSLEAAGFRLYERQDGILIYVRDGGS